MRAPIRTASKKSVPPRKISAWEYSPRSAVRMAREIIPDPRSKTTSPGRSLSTSKSQTEGVVLVVDCGLDFRLPIFVSLPPSLDYGVRHIRYWPIDEDRPILKGSKGCAPWKAALSSGCEASLPVTQSRRLPATRPTDNNRDGTCLHWWSAPSERTEKSG